MEMSPVSYTDLAREALGYIRSNGHVILSSLCAGLLAALIVAHLTPLQYRAAVTVAPQEGLSGRSGLGNLEDLAGITGGMSTSSFDPLQRFTETLTNNTVASRLILDAPWLLPTIFPSQWAPDTKKWHPPTGIFASVKQGFKTALGLGPWQPPDFSKLQRILERKVAVDKQGRYPIYRISLEWRDPATAAQLLNLVLKTNDSIIQHDAQTRLSSTVSYLQSRLRVESEVSRRNALNQLLLEQERSLMAAEVTGPYAAKIIDRMSTVPVFTGKVTFGLLTFVLTFLATFFSVSIAIRRRESRTTLFSPPEPHQPASY